MNENEVKKCPKCSGEMETGHLSGAYYWRHGRSMWTMETGKRTVAYKCRNCGYVELFVD